MKRSTILLSIVALLLLVLVWRVVAQPKVSTPPRIIGIASSSTGGGWAIVTVRQWNDGFSEYILHGINLDNPNNLDPAEWTPLPENPSPPAASVISISNVAGAGDRITRGWSDGSVDAMRFESSQDHNANCNCLDIIVWADITWTEIHTP